MGLDIYLYKETSEETPEEIGYYRKFNAFLGWVHDHVHVVENCTAHPIGKEDWQRLRETLQQLNQDNCEKLFPTRDGFLFGHLDYDEWYWEAVDDLKEWIDTTIPDFDFEKSRITFYAWW